jgi:hypothetical protein
MSGEREINHGHQGGNGDFPEGGDDPNPERLQELRNTADAFGAAADRAFNFATKRSASARQILDSIRNTPGQ